jgi:hypothetical protein
MIHMQSHRCWHRTAPAGICDNVLTAAMSKRRRVVKEPEATEDARRALGAELAAYRTAAGYNPTPGTLGVYARLGCCALAVL